MIVRRCQGDRQNCRGASWGSCYVNLVVQRELRVEISTCRGLRPASVGDYCMFGCCKVLVLIIAIDHSLMILLLGMLAGVIRVKQACFWGQIGGFSDSSKCRFSAFS